jgi:hypothetical protein
MISVSYSLVSAPGSESGVAATAVHGSARCWTGCRWGEDLDFPVVAPSGGTVVSISVLETTVKAAATPFNSRLVAPVKLVS